LRSKPAREHTVWYALDLETVSSAREAVDYAVMEAGALGTEFHEGSNDGSTITAYFSTPPERERIRKELMDAFRIYSLPSSSVRQMTIREVADRDWLQEWKESWQPIAVGNRFVIAPPWSDTSEAQDRFVIHIEPGMAFGTGTHETTRLCLELIEKYFEGGSFLDVGTGTGILAIAAAKLFPDATVVAYDTDAEAVTIARENARLNETEQIEFHIGSVDDLTASANLVCANLITPAILELLPALVNASCGRLILSGILETQVHEIEARLHELGIDQIIETLNDGEWVALVI